MSSYFAFFLFTIPLLCIGLSGAISSNKPVYKSLMGSPSEFSRHMPPSPRDSAVSSRSHMLPWASFRHGGPYLATFEVDSDDYVSLAVISKTNADLQSMTVLVTDPTRTVIEPSLTANESIGMDGLTYPTLTFAFLRPMVGQWCIEISTSNDDVMQAAVLIGYSGPVIWHTSIDSHELLTGSLINIQAVATDEDGLQMRKPGEMPSPLRSAFIEDASITLFNPNDTTVVKEMVEGVTGDVEGTGFESTVQPTVPGMYVLWTQTSGFFRTGNKSVNFQRSSWMSFSVVEKSVSLAGTAHVHSEYLPLASDVGDSVCSDEPHFWIAASVKPERSINSQYRVYAEVWGKHFITGTDTSVAWISGMSDVSHDTSSTDSVSLRLDIKWLLKAFAFPPYSLHNVRIEEIDSFISVSTADHIAIELFGNMSDQLKQIVATNGSQLNPCECQVKHTAAQVSNHSSEKAQSGAKLILVHGYCSSEHTFPESQFTDVAFFEDFKQSRSTDEFARLIRDFGDQFDSFGLAAHSHGGIASLHLYTYYESGLDKANGERLIQTIGTPYHGTPLADLLASIGKLIGIGCGPNPDLSYDGMERWLAAIPADKQEAVHYYTTQYKTGGLVNYCLLPSNLILSWPNDGLIEKKKTDLPYGNPAGHSEGECHTKGMNWPPQTQNPERNEEINRLAAR